MRPSCLVALLAVVMAGGAVPASAQTTVDGFVGYEKQVTHMPGQGEPEIAVAPHGTPLLLAALRARRFAPWALRGAGPLA